MHTCAFGLGNVNQVLPYFPGDASNDGKGTFIPEQDTQKSIGDLAIKNGDEFVNSAAIFNVDCIKIDVEGFERYAIEGLKETICRDCPRLVFEFGRRTKNTFASFHELKSTFPDGYHFFHIQAKRNFLFFFNIPGYRLATFDFNKPGGNVLAIHKDDSFLANN